MRNRPWLKWLIGGGVGSSCSAWAGSSSTGTSSERRARTRFELTEVDDGTDATTTTAAADGADAGDLDGTWTIATGSEAGYRAEEILFGQSGAATGRTSDVTGSLDIAGTTVEEEIVTVDARERDERREPARQPVPGPHHGRRDVPDCRRSR